MTRYTVGIDLGTSNTVVAYATAGEDTIRLLRIGQWVGPGEFAARPLLPSVRYHAAPGELDPGELVLPWSAADGSDADIGGLERVVIGTRARELGAQVPGRVVASAKSWLSNPGVDRTAPILPWGADDGVDKVSPLAASASYLAHVRAAWNAGFPDDPLERQDLVLTVPASFDEGARALTVEAARLAGLPTLRLLEEPQAAFHDWLFRHRNELDSALGDARSILVCDVGGGTTDLTLIRVEPGDANAPGPESPGGPAGPRSAGPRTAGPKLTRVGVGDHLMLGGDNMDLTLAHVVEPRLGAGAKLSAARFSQLVHRCRIAKERLLAADAPERVTVTLLGAGSRLVGGAASAELTRDEVERLLVDGFLPDEDVDARPHRRRSAIVEFGLPYPADPAITRHLAAFVQRHAAVAGGVPDTVLLNGGVFHAAALTARLVDTLARWRGTLPRVLHNDEPDVAVARGAVAWALLRSGAGPRVGGGSPRSYFLELDEGGPLRRGFCVLPRGSEEGHDVDLPGRSFALRLGQPVRFGLVSSAGDEAWQPGEIVELDDERFVRLPPLTAALPAPRKGSRAEVAVRLVAAMTEVGTLEMHCVSTEDPRRRWLLAFQLRGEAVASDADAGARLPPRFDEAVQAIDRVFGSRSQAFAANEVRRLRARLERLLGPRENWDLPLLRALFDALMERARRRRRSAEHERVWLNLAGWCLRPGTGDPLDEWRIERLWPLYEQGLQYVGERRNWPEWWTLWRRAAGGLTESAQLVLLEALAGHLEDIDLRRSGAAGAVQASYDDMVRLSASLERVPVHHRIEVGAWLLERLRRPNETPQTWWALGRVGAREPLYGSTHNVVPADTAATWLQAVLALDWKAIEPAAFAAAQIARATGDRARDLPQPLRDEVVRRLKAAHAPPSWIAMVREVVALDDEARGRMFGESLPPGLKLIGG